MEKVSVQTYTLLTKPGIILGNLITTTAGFLLGGQGHFDLILFLVTALGVGGVIASACVCNNYIDRAADRKMHRTKNRALATGEISGTQALMFAAALGILGVILLFFFTNTLALGAALLGFLVYVFVYSLLKYRSVHGTLVGSIAGATPPVVGYFAAGGHLDIGVWLLFGMLVLWQMPHFFAIAIFRLGDYIAASIPVLPYQKGMWVTKVHMLAYIVAFGVSCFVFVAFGVLGYGFGVLAALLTFGWGWLCVRGFRRLDDTVWAKQMFLFSLLVILGVCGGMVVSVIS